MALDLEAVAKMAQAYTAAWNSHSPDAVAAHYAEDGQIIINRGAPSKGRAGIRVMAAGFYADVPDMSLTCDDIRCAGTHAVYVWTFTGHLAVTRRPLRITGWEEWELDANLMITASLGWFDAEEYARQVEGR